MNKYLNKFNKNNQKFLFHYKANNYCDKLYILH